MRRKDLGRKITSGLFWTYFERILAQGVSTLVTIILARLLLPEDYGIVSIILIFITIFDALVVGGFSDTLIQKKDADNEDFSTLFWFVLSLGILSYIIIFIGAPYVEKLFKTDLVACTLRVMAIRVPINAIKSIQSAYISKNMMYKYFFVATLFGTVVSAVVGIAMAYMGCGVWALVTQYLTLSIINTIVIWFSCGWKPTFCFSLTKLKDLYSFGWKMQLSTIISVGYAELESFCIGTKYTSADLALYDRGRQFPKLIVHNVQTTIGKVMLPAFSLVKTDIPQMKELARKSIRTSSFIMCPLLIGLIACSDELIKAVLTEKWAGAIPFLRILSVYYLCEPIMSINKQIVIASGDSRKYLIMEIEKKAIGICLLLAALLFFDKPIYIAIAVVTTQLISIFIQAQPIPFIINYTIFEQLKDISTPLLFSLLMFIPVFAIKLLPMNIWFLLILEIISGMTVYITMAVVTKNQELHTVFNWTCSRFFSK